MKFLRSKLTVKRLALICAAIWWCVGFSALMTKITNADNFFSPVKQEKKKGAEHFDPSILDIDVETASFNGVHFEVVIDGKGNSANSIPVSVSANKSAGFTEARNACNSSVLQQGYIKEVVDKEMAYVPDMTMKRVERIYGSLTDLFNKYGITDWDFTRTPTMTEKMIIFYVYSGDGARRGTLILKYNAAGEIDTGSISITELASDGTAVSGNAGEN